MRFHHTSILTGSRQLAAACEHFYIDNLGMGVAFAHVNDTADYAFYADNVNSTICPFEIIGKAFDARENYFLERYGPGLDHICFIVEDLQAVYEKMSAEGVKFHVKPYWYENFMLAWCCDPCGIEVELLQTTFRFPEARYTSSAPKAQYHHITILAGSLELAKTTEAFYCDYVGLKKVSDHQLCEVTDGVFLSDSSQSPNTWIEIIGSTHHDNERAFLENKGPGIEHHCFVVENIDRYHRFLKNKGKMLPSIIMEISGGRMFSLYDPANVCIWVLQLPWE